MLDPLPKVAGLQRTHERDAVIADAHELHPEALAQPLAVFARPRDLGLVPRARFLLAREDLADPAGEAALLRLDEVTHDLVGAPLLGVEVPAAVVAEGCELRLDKGAGRLEVVGDLIGRELRRRGHETS